MLAAPGQRTLAIFFFDFVHAAGVFFADVQDEQHRLLRKELESADALFFFRRQFQSAQRDVRFERRLCSVPAERIPDPAPELLIFLRSFSSRSMRFSTTTRSLRISSISTSSRSRTGSTEPFSCGTVSLWKQAQHVRQRIRHAHAGQITGIAQGFFRDGGKIQILNRGVRDFGRIEDLRQRVQPGVGNLGDADARFQQPHASGFMHAGQNREQTMSCPPWAGR